MQLPDYPDPIGKSHNQGERALKDVPKDENIIISTIKAFLWMAFVICVIGGSILAFPFIANKAFAHEGPDISFKEIIPRSFTGGHWNLETIYILFSDGNTASMTTLYQRTKEKGYMGFVCLIDEASGKPLHAAPDWWNMDDILEFNTFAVHLVSVDNENSSIYPSSDRYELMKYLENFDGRDAVRYTNSDGSPGHKVEYDGDGLSRVLPLYRKRCSIN